MRLSLRRGHSQRDELSSRAASRASPAGTRPSVMLSFPKSGRTWVSHLYVCYVVYRLLEDAADALLDEWSSGKAFLSKPQRRPEFEALTASSAAAGVVPAIEFVHRFPAEPYWQLRVPLDLVVDRTVVFLVRDPRDVVVSYFHHVRADVKRRLAPDVDISEFLRSDSMGIRAVVAYMSQVVDEAPGLSAEFRLCHYEDLVADPHRSLLELLRTCGADAIDENAVARAVERASFDRLQDREAANAKGSVDVDRLRFRRGYPGRYREELCADDIRYLDRVLADHLPPALDRYSRPAVRS